MSIFSRLGTLLKSNVNDAISKAEDPEKMLNQMLLDMQGQMVEAKKQVAVAIADEKRLQKQFEQEKQLSVEWENEVTRQIRTLMDQAVKENDYLAQDFLRWFINEQLEEVTTMEALLKVIQRAGPDGLLFVESYIAGLGDPHS